MTCEHMRDIQDEFLSVMAHYTIAWFCRDKVSQRVHCGVVYLLYVRSLHRRCEVQKL